MTQSEAFNHSTPALYDRYMGPLLFEPYARLVAERSALFQPTRILETAAGTCIVTRALSEAVPQAQIVATDLNPVMIEFATQRVKARFPASFAADVEMRKTEFMADSQVPWGVEALNGAISQPAWKTKPSWYLVATDDRMIPPLAQRLMSQRAGATVVEVSGSHSVYVSQPDAVAGLIAKAAKASNRAVCLRSADTWRRGSRAGPRDDASPWWPAGCRPR